MISNPSAIHSTVKAPAASRQLTGNRLLQVENELRFRFSAAIEGQSKLGPVGGGISPCRRTYCRPNHVSSLRIRHIAFCVPTFRPDGRRPLAAFAGQSFSTAYAAARGGGGGGGGDRSSITGRKGRYYRASFSRGEQVTRKRAGINSP